MGIAELTLLLKLSFAAAIGSGFSMTSEQFWHAPFGTEQRIPMVGDADGDGRADLLSFWPTGDGVIDFAKTSAVGKAIFDSVALRGFGKNGITSTCGPFLRPAPAADVLAIYADGSVRIATDMAPGTNQFKRDEKVGQIPESLMPKGAVQWAVADFDADGRTDAMCLDQTGKLLLLKNVKDPAGKATFEPIGITTKLDHARQFSAGQFSGRAKVDCVWLDDTGNLYRAPITQKELGTPSLILKAAPQDRLAIGHFQGAKDSDIIIGQQFLPGGDAKLATKIDSLPSPETAKEDGPWAVGDVDGNGKDDLVRFHRGASGFAKFDTFVHFSLDDQDKDKGFFCSTNDGIPDAWKNGRIRPAGLDLAAMGCKIGHRDIVIEIERYENVDEKTVRGSMARAAAYYASLPIQNPDGTRGIALHFTFKPAWPMAKHDEVYAHFDDYFPPYDRRGIVHTMFAEINGPLVAQVNNGNGRFNGNCPEFLHEFGHQLDLGHEGFWPASYCPLYPSLMSYCYSYTLGNSTERIGYSNGSLASLVLNEEHLSERLPFPYDQVSFLAGSPYNFRIKPDPDGKHTLVDWNWNGIFGEEDISADINYSHGTTFGQRYFAGTTNAAPSLVVDRTKGIARPVLFCAQPHKLVLRTWIGQNRDTEAGNWTDEHLVDETDLLSDPTSTYLDKNFTWVAYLTNKGVVLRAILVEPNGQTRTAQPHLIPKTEGLHPTLTTFNGKLALFLWKSPTDPVTLRFIRGEPAAISLVPEIPLEFTSQVPIAAAPGSETLKTKGLWITHITKGGTTEAIQYVEDSTRGFQISSRETIEGSYASHRMTLLWQHEPGMGNKGRIYHFSGGAAGPANPPSAQYFAINTAYPTFRNGWLLRRFDPTDLTSASAPGACFFGGNIIYALRQADDRIMVTFHGNCATSNPMGDFDDIGHIRDYGLSRSLRYVTQ